MSARVASAEAGAVIVMRSPLTIAVDDGDTTEQVVPDEANRNVAFVVPFTATMKSVWAVAAVAAVHFEPVRVRVKLCTAANRSTTALVVGAPIAIDERSYGAPTFDGVAQVPSPRQKVEEEALVPEFRFPTGRFPVTSAERLTAPKLPAPAALP